MQPSGYGSTSAPRVRPGSHLGSFGERSWRIQFAPRIIFHGVCEGINSRKSLNLGIYKFSIIDNHVFRRRTSILKISTWIF